MPELIPSVPVAPTATLDPVAPIEILSGLRAFPMTQALYAGSPIAPAQRLEVGWHDSSVSLAGAFAVVQTGAGLDDLVGEIVQVRYGRGSVFVYVLSEAEVPVALSLYRRAWIELARPSVESIEALVEPVD